MTYETIITAACVIAAASILLNYCSVIYWRDRAERAEADADKWRDRYYASEEALAKIEATIAECSVETVKAIAREAAMSLAPIFRKQAVDATLTTLRRPTLETKISDFFEGMIKKQGGGK